ncbi:MAG TPA: hypothetical protein VGX23_02330 [Actinocrinis sp.]|nr:hypothetical protein [Actinocrinis sp.]
MSVRPRISREQLRSARPLLITWLVIHVVLVLFLYGAIPYIDHGSLVGDVQTYNKWSLVFAHGHFPRHDPQWQYPPGAAVFMVLPRMVRWATGLSYYSAFYFMALVSDFVVFALVLASCRRTAERVARTEQVGLAMPAGLAGSTGLARLAVPARQTESKAGQSGQVGRFGEPGQFGYSWRVARTGRPSDWLPTEAYNAGVADAVRAAGEAGAARSSASLADGSAAAAAGTSPTTANAATPKAAGATAATSTAATDTAAAATPAPVPTKLKVDYTGAWAYLAAVLALGPLVLCRYDICVTMIATLGMVVVGRTTASTWRRRGFAIGVGTMMKAWPVVLVLGLPKRADGRRALLWTVLGALLPTLALMAALPGALGFLREQGDRGLEIESVLAAPFLVARHFGYPGKITHAYGAFQITGPGVALVSRGCVLLTVAGLVWLLAWRRRAALVPGHWSTGMYYDSGLVAVLITIITSRVLSPQYLVWVTGLIALCLTLTPLGRNGTVLARQCRLLLAAIAVTQIEFPWLFPRLVAGSLWVALLVAARNLILLAATWQAARALWRTAPDRSPARADEPVTLVSKAKPAAEPSPASAPAPTRGPIAANPDPTRPPYQAVPDQAS